jgi:hypothetical protein
MEFNRSQCRSENETLFVERWAMPRPDWLLPLVFSQATFRTATFPTCSDSKRTGSETLSASSAEITSIAVRIGTPGPTGDRTAVASDDGPTAHEPSTIVNEKAD